MGLGPQELWAEHLPCTTPGVDPGLWPLPWREMTENLGDRGARRDTKRGRDREGTRRHKLGLGLSVSGEGAPKHIVWWAIDTEQGRRVAVEQQG